MTNVRDDIAEIIREVDDVNAIPLVDLVYALKAADAGWSAEWPGVSGEAVASGAFNGYLDHDGKVTDKGRAMLAKVGFLV